eukprot:CAMPEP_0174280536 /NCGR_PEP_ID=MMETSP0809-20121228/828_1 /TAXON_ID=73025 ORGANISM="Eutreptiella gymnastica-like, Strain CCMP1594" /NCGR_SAMPLE_ID=MMETSP0809 /ASSEMBLY_ACC=CAM_ASM_000658 /LENGTH=126 /DNA_ID=CAMNT_0015373499 /DNA_START=37 /DNA_END=417 /DNA_ORIENTATION=-
MYAQPYGYAQPAGYYAQPAQPAGTYQFHAPIHAPQQQGLRESLYYQGQPAAGYTRGTGGAEPGTYGTSQSVSGHNYTGRTAVGFLDMAGYAFGAKPVGQSRPQGWQSNPAANAIGGPYYDASHHKY